MNALTLMEQDHRQIEELLDRLEKTTERGVKTRQRLFGRIKEELTAHEDMEERIFYPALRGHPKAKEKEIVLEAYEEHDVVDTLMGELSRLSFNHESWGPKAKVMQENVAHHIEEEEGPMFTQARQVFTQAELNELGRQMEARRRARRRKKAA
ncbi:MAG TPA: hemerythrin domain-containing protein [Candidatus Limnocylindria bacterium]|nr:hemerythrin domain-containing protein [Candidatus Limnocylindria bacterium]